MRLRHSNLIYKTAEITHNLKLNAQNSSPVRLLQFKAASGNISPTDNI